MNAPLRRVGVVMLVLFGLLFLNLNNVQVVQAHKLKDDPRNTRTLYDRYSRERGKIVVNNGDTAIAQSVKSKVPDDKYTYVRTYPQGPLYAPVTGFQSLIYGSTGIEQSQNKVLWGEDSRLLAHKWSDLITGKTPKGGTVSLTIMRQAQEEAAKQLGDKKGAVVALDPRTGAILAMYSSPSYDPNPLASHDGTLESNTWKQLNAAPDKPMLNRATTDAYPPGSTFKVIMSALALENGLKPDSMVDAPQTLTLPNSTHLLPNYEGETCSDAGKMQLIDALKVSCNTAFAKIGIDAGADKVQEMATRFGLNSEPPDIGVRTVRSKTGDLADPAQRAMSSIGQVNVQETPLQNALVAATVANGGVQMNPYLVDEILGADLSVISKHKASERRRVISTDIAAELATMMHKVVTDGTGKRANLPGYNVFGKTGTAQNAGADHGWFTGFAQKGNDPPTVAICVFLQNAGHGGSGNATEIAGNIMQTILANQGN
jgi:penicillin-binding protein A